MTRNHLKEELITRLLTGVKVFSGLGPKDVRDLLVHAHKEMIPKDVWVVHEGDDTNDFYIVLSGELSVTKQVPDGKEKILAKLKPGDSFGEIAFLDGRARSASIHADTNCILLRFNRLDLTGIPETAIKVYRNLALLMAEHVRGADSLILVALKSGKAPDVKEDDTMLRTHWNLRALKSSERAPKL